MAGISGFPARAEGVYSHMQTGCKEWERFFDELAPRLETARVLDKELDRKLAHRFNVFDYLRTNELGLSRVIADLLDPKASHGQGVLFLRAFLEKLEGFRETLRWPDLHGTSVRCEEKITEGRIDVVVRIKGSGGETHCLVLENKPYAYDQESQVERYLEYFGKDDRFLLTYLSPTGEGPSEVSVPKDELAKWKNHFAIMPYVEGHEEWEDGFDDYRLKGHSLADWLGECRKNCEVDRLRWFLADLERFCQGRFGGQAMTTDGEGKTVQKFVLEDPTRIETAAAVYESWPAIKDEVCRKFLERLCSAIKAEAKGLGDHLKVESVYYEGETKFWNRIWMYRERWAPYKGAEGPNQSVKCTTICMENQDKGPNGWYIGVKSPIERNSMTDGDRERRTLLKERLHSEEGLGKGGDNTQYWPWGAYVDTDKKNWDSRLVPALHKENQEKQEKGGDITSYFVNRFLEIAKIAVPIIDDIEGTSNS